ncbi:sigma-70 family RNA polymerase sigma factor [Pseudomonas umsongensis]|uniref:Sigma-70 family RNA polymerase sigma factor n=1 Tax=Pseudomonas umsongensis TaxID=198618 RepID=A0AAE6ZST3_9PSED|nr:sigma-70 family RNA polymerase sigma factor [Pseudomonas umsongensis]QJC78677.1 sigma-70 family RNA polymerase sigma factor [Pseudomonas umsongensis]
MAGVLTTCWRLKTLSLPEPYFDYEACLIACARGERQALRDLYQQESARLLGVAKRIARDNALAEDIVHDVFIRIWTRAASFDPTRGSARGWIFSVTRHLALNFMRDNAREVQVSEHSEMALQALASIETSVESADPFDSRARSGRIYLCLEQLEPARRNCILHAYVDGYSHSEISQKLGAPLGTVKAWIKRSLVALRECMG